MNDTEFGMDDFGSFSGTNVGAPLSERWSYPGFGYEAGQGHFMIGTDRKETEILFVPFALRQRKYITDPKDDDEKNPPILGVYHYKTPTANMVSGRLHQHVQVVGMLDGALHIFGAKSWTARAAWTNPPGQYFDQRFDIGLWPRLANYISQVNAKRGIMTTPLCYEIRLGVGVPFTVQQKNNPNKRSTTYPIKVEPNGIRFVGAERVAAYEELYVREGIDEWVAAWENLSSSVSSAPEIDELSPPPMPDGDFPF